MALPQEHIFTAEDYWNLPEGKRAELINGKFYDMAPPSRIHQKLVLSLSRKIADYIDAQNGECEVYIAPFAVNLQADDKTYVEPDISIICDKSKLDERGCKGSPDFIIEVVSPSSRRMDYSTKNFLYLEAGVREYWIVDPKNKQTTVYRYEEDEAPNIFAFSESITVGIYKNLQIVVGDFL